MFLKNEVMSIKNDLSMLKGKLFGRDISVIAPGFDFRHNEEGMLESYNNALQLLNKRIDLLEEYLGIKWEEKEVKGYVKIKK